MLRHLKTVIRSPLLAFGLIGLVQSGCSGLEVNAPILEAAGINLSSKPQVERKMTKNAPLVLPPKLKALPQPGANKTQVAAGQNWPDDPEAAAKKVAMAKCEAEKRYRREGNWNPNKGTVDDFNDNQDALSRSPGIFGTLLNPNAKKSACAKLKKAEN